MIKEISGDEFLKPEAESNENLAPVFPHHLFSSIDKTSHNMMREFVEGAIECLDDCSDEIKECLAKIIIKGFRFVAITPSFRESVSTAFDVPIEQVAELDQDDVVKLGLGSLQTTEVKDAFLFHAEIVDELWRLLLKGEGVA